MSRLKEVGRIYRRMQIRQAIENSKVHSDAAKEAMKEELTRLALESHALKKEKSKQ